MGEVATYCCEDPRMLADLPGLKGAKWGGDQGTPCGLETTGVPSIAGCKVAAELAKLRGAGIEAKGSSGR